MSAFLLPRGPFESVPISIHRQSSTELISSSSRWLPAAVFEQEVSNLLKSPRWIIKARPDHIVGAPKTHSTDKRGQSAETLSNLSRERLLELVELEEEEVMALIKARETTAILLLGGY